MGGVLRTQGKYDFDLRIDFFSHFSVISLSFLVRSSDALEYIIDFKTKGSPSGTGCLVKISKHNSNPFWSYANLFDYFHGFSGSRNLGRAWGKTNAKSIL